MIRKAWLLVPLALFLTGCATCDQKMETLEKRLDALESKVAAPKEAGLAETPSSTQTTAETAVAPESLAPDSPTKKDIQACLKNAGFYEGEVDGKTGPKTKKAVEDFQTANGLSADGKVGPNTWNKLKAFYKPEPAATPLVKGKE